MKKWFHNAIQIKLPTYELLQYVLAAQKANCILGHIKIRVGNTSREMIPPLFYSTLERPQLEYCIQLCSPSTGAGPEEGHEGVSEGWNTSPAKTA